MVGGERNSPARRELYARGAKYTSGRSGSTARQPVNALKGPPSQMPMRPAARAGLEQCSDTDAALEEDDKRPADEGRIRPAQGSDRAWSRSVAPETRARARHLRTGDAADALFYVESGWVKMSAVVPSGKEPVITLRRGDEFFGVRSMVAARRQAT